MAVDFRKIVRQGLKAQSEPVTVTQDGAPFETWAVPTVTEGLYEDGSPYQIVTVSIPEENLDVPVDNGHRFEFASVAYLANGPTDPDHEGILNIQAHIDHGN